MGSDQRDQLIYDTYLLVEPELMGVRREQSCWISVGLACVIYREADDAERLRPHTSTSEY